MFTEKFLLINRIRNKPTTKQKLDKKRKNRLACVQIYKTKEELTFKRIDHCTNCQTLPKIDLSEEKCSQRFKNEIKNPTIN